MHRDRVTVAQNENVMKQKLKPHSKIRLIIQAFFAAFSNGYVKGLAHGKIFTGITKSICVPGMNCYSCPSAIASCPIGSLQAVLSSHEFKFSLYVSGFIVIFGTLFGRLICGFLCPFGLVQDLLFKIPFIKKIRLLPAEKFLRKLRFVFLLIFVILLPAFAADFTGLGEPWFCKWICPAGTLEGGIPLVLLNSLMRGAAGFIFKWKLAILIFTLIASIIVYRPFCRYVCPLGAIYGVFNKVSFYQFKIDSEKCSQCKACQKVCKLNIPVWQNPNSIDCIRCGECKSICKTKAITL